MAALPSYDDARRAGLKKIAQETIRIQQDEAYKWQGLKYDLSDKIEETTENSVFYPPNDSSINGWANKQPLKSSSESPTYVSVLQVTTLGASRVLEDIFKSNPEARGSIGVLNFTGPSPGGKFMDGFNSQEMSIARSTTAYSALTSAEGNKFYNFASPTQYNTHAILFCPDVAVIRDDEGNLCPPYEIDVLSCAAVNARKVRQPGTQRSRNRASASVEKKVEEAMAERMGRILYVFEQRRVRNVVLGAFGTGYCSNDVGMVARIWAKLLTDTEARFKESFDRVIFAITGKETYRAFHRVFDPDGAEAQFECSGKD